MEPIFPYIERVLTTLVELEPYKMTNEIEQNLLDKLKSSQENRCNEYGFVCHVISLLEIQPCEIRPEDLNANTVFRVTFNCIICSPCCTQERKDILVLRTRQMSNSLIVLEGGPIKAIVQMDHIDGKVFDVHGDAIVHKLTSKKVDVGMLVRIRVIGIKYHVYDTSIKMIGSLVDLAHDSDESFYYDPNNDPTHIGLLNRMNMTTQ